jgi:hypothetical protein
MSLRDPSVITRLGAELIEHQASIAIVYLVDHGWQVEISNPDGSLYVHACEGEKKWPTDYGPSLEATIAKAIDQATSAGWW